MTVLSNLWTRSVVVQSVRTTWIFMDKKYGNSNSGFKKVKKPKRSSDFVVASDSDLPNKKMKTDKVETKMDLDKIKEKYNVTFETPPIKSECDSKEYLVMKLCNGLTVLLISDVQNLIDISEVVLDEADRESDKESNVEESVKGSDVEDSVKGSDVEDCVKGSDVEDSVKGSDVEDSVTESDVEDSGPEDPEDPGSEFESDEQGKRKEKLAACALAVGVGSFSDPETVPGIAHFLEHMLFMGSRKFPKENDFDSYISTKGGSTNAFTECEYTSFYFECPDKYLYNSMDRFSNFFVSPLMKRDSMSREREAVESEFKSNMSSDSARLEQLFCSTLPLNNPAHKFMWGNLITLQKNVTDDVLYNTLRDFWSEKYSANCMTLAVQARLPFDVLGMWVAELFGEIPSNNKPKTTFSNVNPSVNKEMFNKIYTVKPVKDTNRLLLTFLFPSVIHLYKSKPYSYLSFLIGHEGEGSLLSYLQEKLWALQMTVGIGQTGVENNSIFSLFTIIIEMTDKGLEHYEDIIKLVFQYIKLLKCEGPCEYIFKEMQIIDEAQFRFQYESEASDYVEELSVNMQLYPPTDYMTGCNLLFEYRPDEIVQFLELMNPDNINVMILSKLAARKLTLDQTEPWFNTKYKLDDIPPDLYRDCRNCETDPNLYFPKPNIYIPNDFSIVAPSSDPPFPENILQDEYMEVWYKPDTKFKLPYGYVKIYLISPIASSSPQYSVMCDMFMSLFDFSVIKETYPASLAGLNYSLELGDSGLILSFSGFNDKLPLLLRKVLTDMVSFARSKRVSEGLYEAVKTRQKRAYYNGTLKASKLAKEIRLSILCTEYWGCISKLEAIEDVTIEKLIEFNENLFENLYIKCLIQGNISENLALDISHEIKEKINSKPIISGTYPVIRTYVLPSSENIIRVQSFNKQDTNCNVTNYYQCGLNNIENSCIIEILLLIMEEPLFDTLRTREQLAYDVNCDMKTTQSVIGLTVTVKSQSDKYSVGYVENRISLFLHNLISNLESMPPAKFHEIVESLKLLKLQEDTHLKDEVKRNWDEILCDEYMFDRLVREVECIQRIELPTVIEYFKKVVKPCSTNNADNLTDICFRKLSIQVDAEGHSKTEEDPHIEDEDKVENNDVAVYSVYSLQIKKSNDINLQSKFIIDIEQFKSKLFIFPSNSKVCRS